MGPRFLIYGLTDPRDGALRYVGKSCNGMTRPRQHRYPSYLSEDRTYKGAWIRELLSLGLRYGIVEIEECATKDVLSERECWWIAFARAWGCRLTNLTDGGDGTPGWKPSEETKRKIGEKARARFDDPAYRANQSEKHKGKSPSPETRAKLAIISSRRWELGTLHRPSDETRARMSASALRRCALLGCPMNGRRHSEETRAKLSAAAIRRFADPSAHPMFGRKHTAESLLKMSASHRRTQSLSVSHG